MPSEDKSNKMNLSMSTTEPKLDPATKKLIGKLPFHCSKQTNNITTITHDRFTATPFHSDMRIDTIPSSPKMSSDGTCTSNLVPSVDTQSSTIWPIDVLDQVKTASLETYQALKQSMFKFGISHKSASHNWKVLQSFNNLGEALTKDGSSFTKYGSEFRPISTLHRIFKHHPLWDRLRNIMLHGIRFPISPIDTTTEKLDLDAALLFGNHKGVQHNPQFFDDLNEKDVTAGFSIPIPLQNIRRINGAALCPMNVIEQNTISLTGEIIDKQRACHDLSFKGKYSGSSINSRVIEEELQQCMFGYCLLRTIHYIVALRKDHPNTPILIQKLDWKSAYRRAHLHWTTAIKCCSIYKDFALIPLRAVFGGSPCPSEWSIVSESAADLANLLLADPDWDPYEIFSPIQEEIPPPEFYDDSITFEPALDMIVSIPTESKSKTDVYIDDMITVALAQEKVIARAEAAVPLAIHVLGRPVHSREPISRSNLICFRKLMAEGRLEEIKTILGWTIDTRKLIIQLPKHKYVAWSKSIVDIMKTRQTTFKALEKLLGRLTHLSVILPHILHFLGNLRRLCMSASKRRKVKVSQTNLDDLDLMLLFLVKANKGINLNTVTFRSPTHIYFADACPHGIGGYNQTGKAWRWQIPPSLLNRATVNMLEHVAATIGPWIDIMNDELPKLSCLLSMTDSTTSAGWLRKSNFANEGESKSQMRAKMMVAREHAARLVSNDVREYSQWFPGRYNLIADSLSRDFHLCDAQLTQLYYSRFHGQIQSTFKIVRVPEEIDSWLCAWLQLMPDNQLQLEQHQPSSLARGQNGDDFYDPLIFPTTTSSTTSTNMTGFQSCQPLHTPSDVLSTRNQEFINWVVQQSAIPSTMWLRPSGATCEGIPDSTLMASLHQFYTTNSKRTRKTTLLLNNKRPYPVVC